MQFKNWHLVHHNSTISRSSTWKKWDMYDWSKQVSVWSIPFPRVPNFLITRPADVLAHNGARASAGTVLTPKLDMVASILSCYHWPDMGRVMEVRLSFYLVLLYQLIAKPGNETALHSLTYIAILGTRLYYSKWLSRFHEISRQLRHYRQTSNIKGFWRKKHLHSGKKFYKIIPWDLMIYQQQFE